MIKNSYHLICLGLLALSFTTSVIEKTMAQAVLNPVEGSAVNNAVPINGSTTNLDLTDEERVLSENFVDNIGSEIQAREACAQLDDPAACQGRGQTKFLGINSELVQILSKAYSSIVGALSIGGKGGHKKSSIGGKDKAASGGDAGKSGGDKGSDSGQGGKDEEVQDYCGPLAAAIETVASLKQQLTQQNLSELPTNADTAQRELLYRAARSHSERSDNAKIQAFGWSAVTGCYTVLAVRAFADWKVWAKLAGSGLLTAFFFSEVRAHNRFATEIRAIADALPGRGDCNPVTQASCFCSKGRYSDDEVTLFQTYCQPSLTNRRVDQGNLQIPCADSQGNGDTQCVCLRTNSCFDSQFFSDVTIPGIGQFAQTPAAADFRSIVRGQLVGGSLSDSSAATSAAARTNSLIGQALSANTNLPTAAPLSKSQKAQAQAATGLGVPKRLAALLAAQPLSASAKANTKRFTDAFKGRRSSARSNNSRRNKVLRFSSARGLNAKSKRKSSSSRRSKRKGGKKSGKTLRFADEAARASKDAAITKDKDAAIFDIISRRYKVSGWGKLEVEF